MNEKTKTVTKIAANPLKQKRTGKNGIIRVAAYCRVSTDDEDQLKSYRVQKEYYTEMITKHPNWRLAGIYADEGITGTLVKKRDQFLKLIEDCEKGKIDKIITKSISRFARNAVDCIRYIRRLKKLGISIYFEEQNIDSLKENTETFIGIHGVMAQTESENISINVKWGINKRMQNGTYLCNMNMLGYRRDKFTKEVYIVPEEAEIVKLIFNKFLDGYTTRQIKALLEERGYKTYTGKKVWLQSTIDSILHNEKYVGDVIFQKTFRSDCLSKQVRQNTGEMEKYLVKDDHEPIIDRKTFNLAQLEFARRNGQNSKSDNCKSLKGRYTSLHVLSELLICGDCGSNYRRKYAKRVDGVHYYWRCISRLDNRDKYCGNHFGLEEQSLQETICRAISKFVSENSNGFDLVRGNLIYALSGNEDSENLYAIENTIKEEEERIKNYSSFILEHPDKYEQYQIAIQDCTKRIKGLRDYKEEINKRFEEDKKMVEAMETIDNYLKENKIDISEFDEIAIRRLIDSIVVMNDQTIKIVFRGGFEISEKYLPLKKVS